jgi:DNA sulfur modification protein DndD
MILRSIRLEDFGLYAGIIELDLVPRRRQGGPTPIVLIGGKNGAGKTTLLEAVRLALYGRRALGARVGQGDYDKYLRERINRDAKVHSAAVALEFDYAEAGETHRYHVRREWAVRGKSVVETLLLDKDGAAVASVPREEWHHFLQELIPPGVSQLFFFDGEKIREIADDEANNEQLAEAVRGLLGIELVGRLRTDLGLFLARHQRDDDGTVAARLEAVVRDIGIAERQTQLLADQVAELTSVRDSQARAAEQVRRRFIAEGGDAALQRARTEVDREASHLAVSRGEHELRELANKLLPFAMAPKLISTFRSALAQVGMSAEEKGSIEAFQEALNIWKTDGMPKRQASWSDKHWSDLRRFLKAQSATPVKNQIAPAFQEIGDGSAALARLIEVETVVRQRALRLLNELETSGQRVRQLDSALARADSAASGVMLDELRLAEQRVGSTEATLKSHQDELKLHRGQLVTLERERRRLLDEQTAVATAGQRAELAGRAAQALADYERRLLEHKISQLRGEFVRRFNHLARKTDLIADVLIDPTTFAATLVDRDGREVPKASLSAGEKQVYAIAMLWALAGTSGRPLPMIIDTPLARLDSEHRANLVERYFPAASHQVILLSTDTEIDDRLMEDLKSSISHAYRLDYDPLTGRTNVSSGYFDLPGRLKGRLRALQQA